MVSAGEKVIKEKIGKVGYANSDHTARDVIAVLTYYRGLCHSIEPFVFNDGNQKDLLKMQGTIPVPYKVFSNGIRKNFLNLKGTVPVSYKGQSYNIPVCIWLMDTHPNNAPICYVKPTADMRIKVSKLVDHNGKVYLPELHFWDPRKSNLSILTQKMIEAFSAEPPVYSKPRDETPPQQLQQSSYVPYPTQPLMPVPGGSGNPPYPPPNSSFQHNSAPYPTQPFTPFPTPPYPNYHSGSAYPYPSASGGAPYPSYPSYPGGPTTSPSPSTQGTDSGTGTITEEHIRASLLSAVEDKIRRSFREQIARARDELELVRQSQSELESGKNRLDDILSRLSKEQEELDKNIAMLKDKEQELSKAVERLTDQDPVDVDEAVTTTAPLYKQILNTYAEEAATEDTIYYMGEALRRGVIDLDVFLKQVRSLSRRQFMLRALMQKCRLKAGLK